MNPPLLRVVLLHHPSHASDFRAHRAALDRAFEPNPGDRLVSDLDVLPDVWQRVEIQTITSKAAWQNLGKAEAEGEVAPTLFIVLVTDALVNDGELRDVLELVAAAQPQPGKKDATTDLLAYSLSTLAVNNLPPNFSLLQVEEHAQLGERRLAAHKLSLVALQRARALLAGQVNQPVLNLFISHAKADGLFFAQALAAAGEDVPGLKVFYDAKDLPSGSDYLAKLEAAASSSVLIALRTHAYDQRKICRKEFMTALNHGMPVVVVDAQVRTLADPSPLPFAIAPNVRIPDGDTYRVLRASLREDLRLLLMRSWVEEKAGPNLAFRIWPRLPTPAQAAAALKIPGNPPVWLVPQAMCQPQEFELLRDLLAAQTPPVTLRYLETYRPSGDLS